MADETTRVHGISRDERIELYQEIDYIGLSEDQARVQALREEGMSQAEIVEELDSNHPTVSMAVSRIDAKMNAARKLVTLMADDVSDVSFGTDDDLDPAMYTLLDNLGTSGEEQL